MTRVLIPTYAGDIHATAVAIALERKGHEAVLWHATDFPTRQVASIRIEAKEASWTVRGPDLLEPQGPFDVVWFRRPSPPILPRDLHPGDRTVALRAAEIFYRALWQLAGAETFWVNPVGSGARADTKPIQLIEAQRLGFEVPETLFSNDPVAIRTFLDDHPDRAIYKSFRPAHWETSDGVAYLFASDIGKDDLPDDELLQVSVGIYQEKIPKDHELRVTLIGDRAFGAKLLSQENPLAQRDWRRAFKTLRLEATPLSPELEERCRELLKRLGLVFGCFDFVVTPEGRTYFLEVNPMGQFLWLEEGDPQLLLLDAFTEFLIQKRSGFSWAPTESAVRFAAIKDEARERDALAEKVHVARPDSVVTDRPIAQKGDLENRGRKES